MISQISKFLFGFDVFISYPYADGREYAWALERQLTNLDFACFLDKEELAYGNALSGSLERAIRRSRAVVLVATEAATRAPYVNKELEFALKRRRPVIPIDVDGLRPRRPWPALEEVPWVEEAAPSLKEPSAAVLEGIKRHFRFTRRNTISRRAVTATAMALLALTVVALWQWRTAVSERNEAERQTGIAVEQRQEADRQRMEAVRQRNEAGRQQRVAEVRRKEAEEATAKEREARLRGLARQLASQAELVRTESPDSLSLSVLLATESPTGRLSRCGTPSATSVAGCLVRAR